MGIYHVRGMLELARDRPAEALAACRAAERLAGQLAAPDLLPMPTRAYLVHALVRLGETGRAGQVLAGLSEPDRRRGGAPARPARPARGSLRARAGPGRLRPAGPGILAGRGLHAGGDGQGRARSEER